MCGIAGWLNNEKEIDVSVLAKMNNIAGYRGPDDEGYAIISPTGIYHYGGIYSARRDLRDISDAKDGDMFLAFGHRRLSIIDLSDAGHQPMQSDDGELCITFNGEIYNYIELRDELKNKGYTFRSNSDTEVLLTSYREWGENCVSHLNGMWAFAIWDKKEEKLFCSRDRLGAKPFHYYSDDHNFVFGSEMKQVCQNPIVPRVINEEILVRQITWGLTDYSEDTLIRDIKTLRGGCNLVVSYRTPGCSYKRITVQKKTYWDIDTQNKDASAMGELFDIHKNAVQIRTRSDVPIGILLSGGLDSSSLVAEVSEYYRSIGMDSKLINTYTSCYRDYPEGDERRFAELTNEYCNVSGNMIYPDENDTFSLYKDMIWHTEGSWAIVSLGAYMLLRDISKTGIKVVLNGQGSDETMFGYERYYSWYLKDILKQKGIGSFVKAYNEAVRNSRLSHKELLEYFAYFNIYSVRRNRNIRRFDKVATPYALSIAKSDESVKDYVVFKTLSELQYNEIRNTQLTHILRGDDRMYMAFSMESRVPFIDYRYIEKAVQVPENEKIIDGYTKYPLRKHIEGRLPDEVVWRRNKMGWPSPRTRWIDRFDKEKVEELFVESRSNNIFNINKVKKIYSEDPYDHGVEQFINTELFMRLFDVVG